MKVPEARSPPVHVYGTGRCVLDPAAIADPVGTASAAATARDPRILRRIAFSMSTDPLSRPSRGGTRLSLSAFAPKSSRVGLAIGPARRMATESGRRAGGTHPPRSPATLSCRVSCSLASAGDSRLSTDGGAPLQRRSPGNAGRRRCSRQTLARGSQRRTGRSLEPWRVNEVGTLSTVGSVDRGGAAQHGLLASTAAFSASQSRRAGRGREASGRVTCARASAGVIAATSFHPGTRDERTRYRLRCVALGFPYRARAESCSVS